MKIFKFLLASGSFVFFNVSIFADTSDSYVFDLSNISRKDFVKVHKQYIDFVIEKERDTKYPSFIESKYSWLPNLFEAFPSIISSSYAASSESCVFGGWVSKKRSNGRCIIPWHARVYAKNQNVDEYGPKCGASNLFRCSSTLFGPGPTKDQMLALKLSNASGVAQNHNEKGGICVETGGTFKGLTKKCVEMSKKLDDLRGKSWLEEMSDENFNHYYKNKFEPLKKFVDNFCSSFTRSHGDKLCEGLESRVNNILESYRLRAAVETAKDLPIITRGALATPDFCPIVEQTFVVTHDSTVSDSRKLPSIDESKFNGLMSGIEICIKGDAKKSKDAQSLYESLAVMMTDLKCDNKIANIKSKLTYQTRGIDLCSIKLDEQTTDIGGGHLIVTLMNGKKKEMTWDANHLAEMSVQDWLYGQPNGPSNGHVGFYKQDALKDICTGKDGEIVTQESEVEEKPLLNEGEEFLSRDSKIAVFVKDKEKIENFLDNNLDVKDQLDKLGKDKDVKYTFVNLTESGNLRLTVGHDDGVKTNKFNPFIEQISSNLQGQFNKEKPHRLFLKDDNGHNIAQYRYLKKNPKKFTAKLIKDDRPLPAKNKNKFDGLMSEKDFCVKGNSKKSHDANSLYEALAVMMTDLKCDNKISNIKSKLTYKTRGIDLCSIKLDEQTTDIGGGHLIVTLMNGKKKEMTWDANHLAEMSVQDWLYGQPSGPSNGHVGFYEQDAFKDICTGKDGEIATQESEVEEKPLLSEGEKFLSRDSKIAVFVKDKEKIENFLDNNLDVKDQLDKLGKDKDVKYTFVNLTESGNLRLTVGHDDGVKTNKFKPFIEQISSNLQGQFNKEKPHRLFLKDDNGHNIAQYRYLKKNPKKFTAKLIKDDRPLPEKNKNKFDGLMSEKDFCVKGNAKNSHDANSLYEALAVMMTDLKCDNKISKIKSKLTYQTRGIDLCSIKLDEQTTDIGGGHLIVTLMNGKKKEMTWDANHLAKMSVQDWLYGQTSGPSNGHVGFYKQDAFKDICPNGGLKKSVSDELKIKPVKKDKKDTKPINKKQFLRLSAEEEVPSSGIHFLTLTNSPYSDKERTKLLEIHEQDFIRDWLINIERNLPKNTPFIIGESEKNQNNGGVYGWNYFDIGAGVHVSEVNYDAEIQKRIKKQFNGKKIPGIIYSTRDVDLVTVSNETFERVAALKFKQNGYDHYEEYSTFQTAGLAIDEVFLKGKNPLFKKIRQNPENINWDNILNEVNLKNSYWLDYYIADDDKLLPNSDATMARKQDLQLLMGSLLKEKISKISKIPSQELPFDVNFEVRVVKGSKAVIPVFNKK